MFDLIKSRVSLPAQIEKDAKTPLKIGGTNTYVIENEREHGGCPFCGHKDCFRVFHEDEIPEKSSFKCFSCGEYGDVIMWISKFHKLDLSEAAKYLIKEYDINIPRTKATPEQELFTLAADYYFAAMWENSNEPIHKLGDMTPVEYQLKVRKHTEKALKHFKVGWSDGGLCKFLEAFGHDEQLLIEVGLKNAKSKADYLPAGCFVYPHFVEGRVSHFTIKDPEKKILYQLPNRYRLNGHLFYNQSSARKYELLILVEGENDVISVWNQAQNKYGVIGTIGSISGEQMDWLVANCKDRILVTIFDPDNAGDLYREKIQTIAKYFTKVCHVKPPNDKDIDELLREGGDLESIVEKNEVIVTTNRVNKTKALLMAPLKGSAPEEGIESINKALNVEDKEIQVTVGSDSEVLVAPPIASNVVDVRNEAKTEAKTTTKIEAKAKKAPKEESASNTEVDSGGDVEVRTSIYEYKNQYFKDRKIRDQVVPVRLSNFTMEITNVYIEEGGRGRIREVVLTKENGLKSKPIPVNSESKTSLKNFRVLVADCIDADFFGTDADLSNVWEYVTDKHPDTIVTVLHGVGRSQLHKHWAFKNVLVTSSGVVHTCDENGVFWTHGNSRGFKVESLNEDASDRTGIPELNINMSKEETEALLVEYIHQLGKNLGSLGDALTMVGWMKYCVYSDEYFNVSKGSPFLFLSGGSNAGKGTICSWLQGLYGMNSIGRDTVPQIKSGVGLARRSQYYRSLPLWIDEVRDADMDKDLIDTFRVYYDRSSRNMGAKDPKAIRVQGVNSCLMFAGEDIFTDTATRMRCLHIRVLKAQNHGGEKGTGPSRGDTRSTYEWFLRNQDKFSAIGFDWIKEASVADGRAVADNMMALSRKIQSVINGDTRKNVCWAAGGYFGLEFAQKYFPKYDYWQYLLDAGKQDGNSQEEDNMIARFFSYIESMRSGANSPISDKHIHVTQVKKGSGKTDRHLIMHYRYIFDCVMKEFGSMNKGLLTRNSLLSAIMEEPYFVGRPKIAFTKDGHRFVALELNLELAPEFIKDIVA